MANLQDLMALVKATPPAIPTYTYRIYPTDAGAWIGKTIRTHRPIGEVREAVRQYGLRRFGRFTFTVRPESMVAQ